MGNPSGRIAAAAIDEPLVADVFVALQETAKELLHFRVLLNQWVEVACLTDHDFAANYGLDAIVSGARSRQDTLAGEAKRHNLAAAGRIGLELRENPRPDEHDFVPRTAGLAKGPPRFNLDDPVRNRIQHVGQTRLQPRGDQSLAQGYSLPRRFNAPTRHLFSPKTDYALTQRRLLVS